ncbi:unnamed protein product [Sphacelaria rigidula]
MSGKISCGKVVTAPILPSSTATSLQIGNFSWPTNPPSSGTVLKTAGDGSLAFEPSNVRAVVSPTATSYDIQPGDDIVAITGTLETTLKLPDPALKTVGDRIYVVKDVAGTSNVTVVPFGSELISGKSSATLRASFGSFKLYTNGVNYFALF